MPRVAFEPTIRVFEGVKKFHALDLAATVIGQGSILAHFSLQCETYLLTSVVLHQKPVDCIYVIWLTIVIPFSAVGLKGIPFFKNWHFLGWG
jgi:hypothetical protein